MQGEGTAFKFRTVAGGELNEMLSSKLDLHGKVPGQQQQKRKNTQSEDFPMSDGVFFSKQFISSLFM